MLLQTFSPHNGDMPGPLGASCAGQGVRERLRKLEKNVNETLTSPPRSEIVPPVREGLKRCSRCKEELPFAAYNRKLCRCVRVATLLPTLPS
eukprot:2062467-Amphidinium_carterae.1